MTVHEHILVLIRTSSHHKIYWCRICGTISEFFDERVAFMVPEKISNEISKDDFGNYKFDKEKLPKRTGKRLGRGLKDIQSSDSKILEKLFKDGEGK